MKYRLGKDIYIINMLKKYLCVTKTNIFNGRYTDVKYLVAKEKKKYTDEDEVESYNIVIIHSSEEVNEAEKLLRDREGNKVIYADIQVPREVALRLRDLGIEVFDTMAYEEVKMVVRSMRGGINLPNFGRGRLKYYITQAVKKDIILIKEGKAIRKCSMAEVIAKENNDGSTVNSTPIHI